MHAAVLDVTLSAVVKAPRLAYIERLSAASAFMIATAIVLPAGLAFNVMAAYGKWRTPDAPVGILTNFACGASRLAAWLCGGCDCVLLVDFIEIYSVFTRQMTIAPSPPCSTVLTLFLMLPVL